MNEKRTGLFENGLIWFGAGVSIAEILTGTYLAPLGMGKGLAAILIGHIIGCLMLFLAGVIGGSTSGEVDLALRKCPDKIELTTVSGDVDLELPRNAGFTLRYSTASGDLESDFPLTAGRTYGDGSGSITIDTTSGDLKIENLD